MRSLRKQMKLVSSLSETVLQQRLNCYAGLNEHLGEIRKKIRHMQQTQNYEEGISEMLISKQNYQIRNKLTKLEPEQGDQNQQQIVVQIRITAIEKSSCQKYNQQLWEFCLLPLQTPPRTPISHHPQPTVALIQHVLSYLMCYTILPLNKHHKAKYMLDHRVTISHAPEPVHLLGFGDVSSQEFLLSNPQEGTVCRLLTKYFFNEKKVQQSLKQIIISRSLQSSGQSKKNSLDTTCTSKRVSFYQFHDDDLDITVLSSSDFSSDNGQEMELELQTLEEEEEEFQLLIEQTTTLQEDELFFNNNMNLLKQLSCLQYEYF